MWVGPQAQGSRRGSKCLVQREPLEDDAQSRGGSGCRQYPCVRCLGRQSRLRRDYKDLQKRSQNSCGQESQDLRNSTTNPTWGQEAGL